MYFISSVFITVKVGVNDTLYPSYMHAPKDNLQPYETWRNLLRHWHGANLSIKVNMKINDGHCN